MNLYTTPRSVGALVALFSLFLSTPSAQAQTNCCKDIIVDHTNPFRYAMRGQAVTNTDRCEGFIKQKADPVGLHIASFTAHFEEFPHSEGHNLLIQWSAPDSARVSITATGLTERRQAYRMDTVRPAADSVFVWRRNIISRYGITRDDLGLIGTVDLQVEGRDAVAHIPLRISERPYTDRPTTYNLVLVPEHTVDRLDIAIANVHSPSQTVWSDQLDNRDQDATPFAVAIPVNMLPQKGLYRIRVSATGTQPASTSLLFYNPYQTLPLLIQNTGHNERQHEDNTDQAQHRVRLPKPE